MKSRVLGLLLLGIFLIIPTPVLSVPVSDGIISTGEWDDAFQMEVEMTNSQFIDLRFTFDENNIYFLAVIPHNSAGDEIILDTDVEHDYFGIEFDNNGDQAIMGTLNSPDDTILVNYEENIASDMYMHNFKAYHDREHGGIDNVTGKAGNDSENLIFEFQRPLETQDYLGYDTKLEPGDEVGFMLAFWDDKNPHAAAVYVNTRVGNDQFLTLTIGEPADQLPFEIVTTMLLLLSMGVGWFLSQKTGLLALIKS